jgi:hypothetical protein
MKKTSAKRQDTPIRAEYDFSKGVRGKYAQKFREGTNIVVLVPEVTPKLALSSPVWNHPTHGPDPAS